IFGFDCHNTLMTADLRKTLRAKEFPKMKIHFLSLNKFPELRSTEETITGWVNIELSGVTKKFDVKFRFYTDDQKIIHLIGIRSINFSDFNLTPPRKLGGIIQTKDKLDVEFGLNFKTLN
ncbi:MAG: YceI family protein, partial [Bacteroidota bacterium]|nr:YceI family protein [Bacteroidota bacterium]